VKILVVPVPEVTAETEIDHLELEITGGGIHGKCPISNGLY
jgi:hypothetical protein